jgi:hypothetical protein
MGLCFILVEKRKHEETVSEEKEFSVYFRV